MPKIVNNSSEITFNNKWISSTKFIKDRLVDEKSHTVSSDYKGRKYRIIERERTFSELERFGRGLLGTVAVVCTLFLGLFFKSVRNLFTKYKENIRFTVLVSAGNPLLQRVVSIDHPPSVSKVQSDKETIKLGSICKAAPWEEGPEPRSLPENWERHRAKQNIIVNYDGGKVNIPRGNVYFTYQGKIAIGHHGSYNPPHGM